MRLEQSLIRACIFFCCKGTYAQRTGEIGCATDQRSSPVQHATATMFENRSSQISPLAERVLTQRADALGEPRAAAAPSRHDLICTHDLYGRILSVNPSACEALGVPAAALIGMLIQELLPPDVAPCFDAYIARLRGEGCDDGLMKVLMRDGSTRIWEYRNTLSTDETFAPIIRGVARDVTEREEAIRALRRSEEQFRSIIENTSDIIAVLETDGLIRYESPSVARVLGYPRNVLIGTPLLDLIHPEDASGAAAFLDRQIADPGAIQSIELRARHHGGQWRSLEIVAKNMVERGVASAIVMNARDITERKLLEAQLLQANRLGALGRLAATVAHEFNNVLMGMQPFAELMQRPDARSQMVSKGAWHIANSIKRGRRIVLDILRFAQPYEPATAAIDLGEWWETFAPEAEAVLGNMIPIVSAIPRGLCVIADRTQLSQVLSNLVANARDAMPTGGAVTISANHLTAGASFPFGVVPHPDRFVQISIRDTGHGMPAEVMDRIFEPLYTTRQSGGTGLGLAVAHQVMTQHGGYIFVESEPGLGSTFNLFLPKAVLPSSEKIGVNDVIRAPAARKLLIIDDEQSIVEGITALLEQDGIEVVAIGSGIDAAKAVASFHPDVVLLDFGLPDIDGTEVYACIRELDRSLPVIFATGHGDRRTIQDGLHDPRTRFLQKPFEVSALLEMMADLETGGSP